MISMAQHKTVMDELQPGDTTRVNHEDCSAGEDTRRRLYLTRVMSQPDLVIGYCHNCQQNGRYSMTGYVPYRKAKHGPLDAPTIVETLQEPKHIDRDVINWPTIAKAWAIKNKITQTVVDSYLLGYDPSTNRIYLPRYASTQIEPMKFGSFNGYQLRLLEGEGPKYLTVISKKDKGYSALQWDPTENHPSAIIVEDLLSGIAIAEAMQAYELVVFVNYGTKINIELVHHLSGYKDTTIWLDNDSTHVRRQAKDYIRTVGLFTGHDTCAIEVVADPKHYSSGMIRDTIKGVWDRG